MIKILITSIESKEQWDVSQISTPPKWSTSIENQPGKLTFDVLKSSKVNVSNGDLVEMSHNSKNLFKGKVFNYGESGDGKISITAYDFTRYLQNENTIVFNNSTVDERFQTACNHAGLPHRVIDKSTFKCPARVADGETYFTMINDALQETREGDGTRWAFWDNFGNLEFFNLNSAITRLVIGDESLLITPEYQSSIDDAANSVIVQREDRETGNRESYQAKDDKTIDKWGMLQVVEKVNDPELNSAQLKQQAKALLSEKNVEKETLTITALGNTDIRAGNSFILNSSDLGINEKLTLVKTCEHDFSDYHSMKLKVEVLT